MRATARAQPNIALIKYWGKSDTRRNLPAVGSISITLADLCTTMCVEFDDTLSGDALTVNGRDSVDMLPRVARCLDTVAGRKRPAARVLSTSNFPIAAGLASSASAFAALVVAADAAEEGGVELENTDSDISLRCLRPADEWPLRVVVAVTTVAQKPVSSTEAMELSRKTSPFFARWVEQQESDLAAARTAIASRDFSMLASISEHNCLKMHSVMWASRPPVVYWNSATLACMQAIRELQNRGVAVFFTIDAGPQLKAVCEVDDEAAVRDALGEIDGVEDILVSGLGAGAARIADV